jgi:hypothetical protein
MDRRIKVKESSPKNLDWGDDVFMDSLIYDPLDT